MELNIRIRYSTESASWLCFRHAVQRAMKGEDVSTDVNNYDSEHYMGRTSCVDCEEEEEQPE